MRVLVTGGTGFLGNAVVTQLRDAAFEPVILSSRTDFSSNEYETVSADLTNSDQVTKAVELAKADAVCHLAALTRVRDSFEFPIKYYDVNLGGTLNLLQACEKNKVSKLVYMSTGAVYGPCDGVVLESTPTLPTNPYGASKLAAEQLVHFQAKARGLTATILRCFNISGAVGDIGDFDTTRIIPKTLAVAGGKAEYLGMNGDGSVIREFVHVRDVAFAIICALLKQKKGGVGLYNIGSGVTSSMMNIVEVAQKITGREVSIRYNPPRKEPHRLVASSDRLRSELQWQPNVLSIERMIEDAWEAYRLRFID